MCDSFYTWKIVEGIWGMAILTVFAVGFVIMACSVYRAIKN